MHGYNYNKNLYHLWYSGSEEEIWWNNEIFLSLWLAIKGRWNIKLCFETNFIPFIGNGSILYTKQFACQTNNRLLLSGIIITNLIMCKICFGTFKYPLFFSFRVVLRELVNLLILRNTYCLPMEISTSRKCNANFYLLLHACEYVLHSLKQWTLIYKYSFRQC